MFDLPHDAGRLVHLVLALALVSTASGAPATDSPQNWVATWAASVEAADPDPDEPLLGIERQTVRQRVRVSIGGEQLRVRLSNEHGSTPLIIGSATVGLPTDAASVKPGSLRSLTFEGRSSVTLPPVRSTT